MNDLSELFLGLEIDIHEINTRAAREGWTFWTTPMGAEDWHKDYGYMTYTEVENHQILGEYSDLYKELFGVRPRGPIDPKTAQAKMESWLRDEAAMADYVEEEPQPEVKNTQLADQLAALFG